MKHAASYTTYCLEYWFRFLPCKHRTSVNFHFTWFPITKEKNVWHVIIVFIEFRTYSCEEKTILSQLGNSENQILRLQLYMSSIWKRFSQTGFLLPVFQFYSSAMTHLCPVQDKLVSWRVSTFTSHTTWLGTVGCRNVLGQSSYNGTGRNNFNLIINRCDQKNK